jgi:hypothetical protein
VPRASSRFVKFAHEISSSMPQAARVANSAERVSVPLMKSLRGVIVGAKAGG